MALLVLTAASAAAQALPTGRISGTVVAEAGRTPLVGVHVFLEDSQLGTVSDNDGSFDLRHISPGRYVLVARFVGFETHRQEVEVEDGTDLQLAIVLSETTLYISDIVVTATGERQSRSEIAATVQTIGRETINRVKPAHPSEIMGRIPGVWVNVTSGEGHMTAIRQPLTTEAVYLYLENGIPTRSTGFFNHNALYETNLPMAENIEVIKGPGTALYGSDAIGGVINVSTRRPPIEPVADLSVETGSFGFRRLMLGTGTHAGAHAFRLDLNSSRSDGWRDASRYERNTGSGTWLVSLSGFSRLKTVASFSFVDSEPAGSVALSKSDYEQNPTLNYAPVSYRDVRALRISSAYERFGSTWSMELTPYFRFNEMDILPNWSLSYDPTAWRTRNLSFGAITRFRREFSWARVIGGIDIEHSPGRRKERRITVEREGRVFVSYTREEAIYDYSVAFNQVSSYLHTEASPWPRLRFSGGIRLDVLGYDYGNDLSVITTGVHRRAASTSRHFVHLSPKLGATYRIGSSSSAFLSYRRAFRVPSEDQLFRQGSTDNSLSLEPVVAANLEGGFRLHPVSALELEMSAYRLSKTNDIVPFVDESGLRIITNAGKTSHMGIETGVHWRTFDDLDLQASLSYAIHRFERWAPSATQDLSGNEMDAAPRLLGFAALTYSPSFARRSSFSLEWMRLGSYWMDPANSIKYDGHSVLNARTSVDLPMGLTLFGRIINLTDAKYAERATFDRFRGEEFAPGAPRAIHIGLQLQLSGEDQP